MAFLIPDNLKSRSDVTAGIRRTASAFQVGLDEDVTVWYEPLYDPSGRKPHLVILFPDRGIVVLEALEVKSGGILGSLRGKIRMERDGQEVERENPLERAKRLSVILRDRIQAEERLLGKIPVSAGAVFPALTKEEAASKGIDEILDLDMCLFKPELEAAISGKGTTALMRRFVSILGGAATSHISEEEEKLLRGIIQPETVIDKIASKDRLQLTIFRPSEDGDVVRVMDRQQEAMAKSLGDGHRVIRGVAGSGKTLILVYRARLLSQMYPEKQILVTCYTRSLTSHLRHLLDDHPNVSVQNLDRIMADVISKARRRHPGYKDGEGEEVARVALQAQSRVGLRYDAVLVDEAQDFGTTALRFLVSLLGENDDLVIVADAAQNIFRRKFSWKQAGIQAQGRTRILRINYRNTKQILQFASAFLLSGSTRSDEVPDLDDEDAVIPPEAAAREGDPPSLILVDSIEEEVSRVLDRVADHYTESLPPRSIAILYGTNSARIDRALAIEEGLRRSGRDVFWANNPQDRTLRDKLATAQEPIILSTIYGSKGLEFPQVILCGLWREKDDAESNRKLAYVGMTRATERLSVVAMRDNALSRDLQSAAG